MEKFFEQRTNETNEQPKLLGTFVNEIYGLAARLKMNHPKKIRRYLEREDVQKKHTEQGKQALISEIKGLDEKVQAINDAIDRHNSADENMQDEIKQEILIKCDEIIDLLYGDNPGKEALKRNLR